MSMQYCVALRKESVDRNHHVLKLFHHVRLVALRKESVDRNLPSTAFRNSLSPSLSARRAWIEIYERLEIFCCNLGSLSARRAWIEILDDDFNCFVGVVALRKESVDRNAICCNMLF